MKYRSAIFSLLILILMSCNSNNAKSPEETSARSSQTKDNKPTSATPASPGDGIVGGWILTRETYDENNNKMLDEEERKKGFKNRYYYRFNADGTCKIQTFDGFYELSEYKGKKLITTYFNEDGKKNFESKHYIFSVDKNELVFLDELASHVFWIFKRE